MFEDADLTHPWATKYRIPLISGYGPSWLYEVALIIPESEDNWRKAIWPDEDEAKLIGDYINYRRDYYNQSYQNKMLAKALDVHSSTNTVSLIKTLDRGWGYNRMTWTSGPAFVYEPTLTALLDRINEHSNR